MPPFSATIDNMLQGVSQQPTYLRLPTQSQEQINTMAWGKKGLGKRPGTDHEAIIATTNLSDFNSAFMHTVARDLSERYRVAIFNGDLKVYNLDGSEVPVLFPDGKTYLTSSTPDLDFRAATIGDRTIITNKQTTTARAGTVSAAQTFEALVFVRDAEFDTSFRVTINGVNIDHQTPPVADPGDLDELNTTFIANSIKALIDLNGTLGPLFTVTQFGSTLHIVRTNGADFTIEAEDGLGGEGLISIKGKTQTFENLPPNAPNGTVIEITGDRVTNFDNFWVQFNDVGALDQQGIWEETTKPNEQLSLDPATMPHELVRNGTIVDPQAVLGFTEPFLTQASSGAPQQEGWATALNGAENNSRLITTPTDEAFSNLDTAVPLSTEYTVTYDVDVTGIDGINDVSIIIEINDAPGSTNWAQMAQRNYVQADGSITNETLVFTTALGDTNFDLRARLVYAIAPGPGLNFAFFTMKTVDYTPTTVDILVHFESQPLYPETMIITTTVNGTPVVTTLPSGDVAPIALAGLVAADITTAAIAGITATDQLDGTVLIVDAAPPPTVLVASNYSAATMLITAGLGVLAAELVGQTAENITDLSSAVISSNTDRTIISAPLAGGSDNLYQVDDLVRVIPSGGITFVFRQALWCDRRVGDLVTNPFPSFTGKPILEVFFYKNRLGFTSGENVILTQSGDIFNFFRDSVTDLVDSDPIDIQANTAEVSTMHGVAFWNRQLMVFSDQNQFFLQGDPLLTPKTARLDPVGAFKSSPRVRPYFANKRVYFTHQNGNYTDVREWFPSPDATDKDDARSILLHASKFLPGAPLRISGSDKHNFLVAQADGDRTHLFVYNYLFDDDGSRRQGAWQRWEMGTDNEVLAFDIIEDSLGVLLRHHDMVTFVTMPIAVEAEEAAFPCDLFLDRKITDQTPGVSSSYAAGPNETTITLPYAVRFSGLTTVLQETWDGVASTQLPFITPTGTPAWPGQWDNGSGTGIAPASPVFPHNLNSFGGGVIHLSNATLDSVAGRFCNDVTGPFDNFVQRCRVRKANVAGSGARTGGIFRCDNRRAMPEDNTVEMDDGDFIEVVFRWSGTTGAQVIVTHFKDGFPVDLFDTGENAFTIDPNITQDLIIDVRGDLMTLDREVIPGDPFSRINVVTDLDLTNAAALVTPGATESFNNAAHGAFGGRITKSSLVDSIELLEVTTNAVGDGDVCMVDSQGNEVTIVSRPAINQITVSGDFSGAAFCVGVCYPFEYTFSRFHRRDNTRLRNDGDLKLHYMDLEFSETRSFFVEVTDARAGGQPVRTYTLLNTTVCGEEGTFRFPILQTNTNATLSIKDTSPYGLFFHRAKWEANYFRTVR